MKKKVIQISVFIVIILAVIGLIYASTVLKGKEIDLDKHLVLLTYPELKEKVDNKESFILLFSQTDCPHCAAFKPIFKEVLAKHDITAYEIQTDTLTKEEAIALKDIANVSATPTTIFIENGVEKSTSTRLKGESSSDKIESRLKAVGYIK